MVAEDLAVEGEGTSAVEAQDGGLLAEPVGPAHTADEDAGDALQLAVNLDNAVRVEPDGIEAVPRLRELQADLPEQLEHLQDLAGLDGIENFGDDLVRHGPVDGGLGLFLHSQMVGAVLQWLVGDAHVAQESQLSAGMLGHGSADKARSPAQVHGPVEILGTCPLRVVEDAGRVERDGLGGFGDHALVGDDEVGARCRAWQPEVICGHQEQADRILAHAGLLALKSTGEAERAAAVADFRLNVDAHPGGSVDHLVPRAHGFVRDAGVGSAATAHDASPHAVGAGQGSILLRLFFSLLEGRHHPPDRRLAAELSDLLGRSAAFAGALPAADEMALALLRQPIEPVFRQDLLLDLARDGAFAPPDLSFLLGGGRVEIERRHLRESFGCERGGATLCDLPAGERIDVLAADPGPEEPPLIVEHREAVCAFQAEVRFQPRRARRSPEWYPGR